MIKDPLYSPVGIMRRLGMEPDPWQIEVLECTHPRLLLNCCRQAGKSTVVAMLGILQAIFVPATKILLVSASLRQSKEMFGILIDIYRRLGSPLKDRCSSHELRLGIGSRIVCLPCNEKTIRGYSHVSLMVIDEASRVPEDIYVAVRPMLAVSNGRLICLSTPFGRRGFFYEAWVKGGADWHRIEVPAERIPRISPEVLATERRAMKEVDYRREYCCSFEAVEGLVYPDFERCIVPSLPAHLNAKGAGRRVGGIDFGFRNPFAALWGILDHDGVLWLTNEHYYRQKDLTFHAERLPRDVMWYADPANATERNSLRIAGLKIQKANNALMAGITAVTARLRTGTLRVVQGACPNLVSEAGLYRYDDDPGERKAEKPLDDNNHALAALRYLISKIDARYMARLRRRPCSPESAPEAAAPPPPKKRPWLSIYNEALWTILE
jgi:hypothetical protein